jgi:S1-C subfamily serine protease
VFNDKKYPATFVGRDPSVDLAILEVAEAIPGIQIGILGNSQNVRVGDEVFAFGNPFGIGHTVTEGIVTAKKRIHGLLSYEAYIQTQAPINPGNSGGPLVSKKDGTIIGIVNSGIRGADGMGFVIPVKIFKDIEPELRGTVRRAWIGIQFPKAGELKDADGFQGISGINALIGENNIAVLIEMRKVIFEEGGVLVTDVLRALNYAQIDPQRNHSAFIDMSDIASPAHKAGMQIGDIVKRFGAFAVNNSQDLIYAIFRSLPYANTTVIVVRFGDNGMRREHTFPITPIIRVPESVQSKTY